MVDPLPSRPSSKVTPFSCQPALAHFAHLIRLNNQSGTLLLLLPSFWALILASGGTPDFALLVIFAMGAFFMRSAGVVINDLADRSFDQQVERTKTRPLASGVLPVPYAVFTAAVFLLFSASLLFFLNPLTIMLSPVAFVLASLYPFTKRFFDLPQFFLGLAFGWGTIMAWAAVQNNLAPPVWFLFGATILWALGYDTIYALQDRQDDERIGLKSSAILFGGKVWIAVGMFLGGMIFFLALAGWWVNLGAVFFLFLAGVAGFCGQQVWQLRGEVPPTQAFTMFKQHGGIGLAILCGFWLGCF